MIYNHWQRLGRVFSLDECIQKDKFHYSHTQCPFYLNEDNEERIYFSSRDRDNISRIFYIKIITHDQSINLIDKKIHGPIINKGEFKEFDSDGVMISWILKNDNDYMLYYVGWKITKKFPYQNSIGLSISKNGLNDFKKFSSKPIISKNKHDKFFTGTSCVIKFKNIFFNYYMSCNNWVTNPENSRKEPIYFLKVATSKDGINWDVINKVVIPLKKDWGGVSKASVINIQDKLHMWFSYRGKFDYRSDKNQSYKIGYATSINGYDWEIKDFKLHFHEDKNGDDFMQAYPHVFKKGNKLFMLYNGNEFGKTGVYLAKSDIELS